MGDLVGGGGDDLLDRGVNLRTVWRNFLILQINNTSSRVP